MKLTSLTVLMALMYSEETNGISIQQKVTVEQNVMMRDDGPDDETAET